VTVSRAGLAVLVLGVLLGTGCAATTYDRLVPLAQIQRPMEAAHSVSVSRVTRSYESNPLLESTVPKVSEETFRDALIETLRRSQLLSTAAWAPDSYRLSADIIAEKLTGAFDNTLTLLIRYELEQSGKLVWSENILSQGELSTADVFEGVERQRRLQIWVYQNNLVTLLAKLMTAIAVK
jgi:hypothetical protein